MIKIVRSETASFDVDPQKGFTPLCPDELPVLGGGDIAGELNAQAAHAAVRLVSKDSHPVSAPWMAAAASEIMQPVPGDYPDLDLKWPPHCIVGTEGNRLIPGLPRESEYDLVVEKGQDPLMHPYGACFHDLRETRSTGVIEWLRERSIRTVILGGLATDYCVKTTGDQLLNSGFRVILNLAATRGVDMEISRRAIDELRAAGAEIVACSGELNSE